MLFSVKQVIQNNVFCIHGERSSQWINFLRVQLFSLARWQDNRLRGTANIIVICIAIKFFCGNAFFTPTFMSKLYRDLNEQTFNFIPTWVSEWVNRKKDGVEQNCTSARYMHVYIYICMYIYRQTDAQMDLCRRTCPHRHKHKRTHTHKHNPFHLKSWRDLHQACSVAWKQDIGKW